MYHLTLKQTVQCHIRSSFANGVPYMLIELAVHLSSIYTSGFIFLSQDILQTRFPMPRYIVTEQGGSQVNTCIMCVIIHIVT